MDNLKLLTNELRTEVKDLKHQVINLTLVCQTQETELVTKSSKYEVELQSLTEQLLILQKVQVFNSNTSEGIQVLKDLIQDYKA